MGVQVVLIGVPTSQRTNQSAALVRETDEHVVLPKDYWDPHFTTKKKEEKPAQEATAKVGPAEAQTAGRAFAVSWIGRGEPGEIRELLENFPRIPRELDIALLVEAEKTTGSLRERQDLKHEVRGAFWAAVHAAAPKA